MLNYFDTKWTPTRNDLDSSHKSPFQQPTFNWRYWRVGVEKSPFSSKQSKLGGEKKSGKTEKVVCRRGIEFFNSQDLFTKVISHLGLK